jgi:hypothetical protein
MISILAIVLVIAISQHYKVPGWLVVVPVTFVLFTLFQINTLFFNKEKTGLVSRGLTIANNIV